MLMRALALLFNAIPVRWQRRFMTAAHQRFLVGVAGLGVDARGRVLLARHRFGAPQWRFLGGFLDPRERVEDALARELREETGLDVEVGPILEVVTGYRWQRVELVFAYRVTGGRATLSDEVVELKAFDPADLPDVRADQRGLIERHAADAAAWARTRDTLTSLAEQGPLPVRVTAIDHVVLTVADIDRTIAFYERALGMRPVTFAEGRRALAFGGQKLNLHQAGREFEPKARTPTPGSVDVCFRTDVPIGDVAAHLEREGIAIEAGPVAKTGARAPLRSVYFRDPDGNLIEVANEIAT